MEGTPRYAAGSDRGLEWHCPAGSRSHNHAVMTIAANDTKVWIRAPGGQIWQLTAGTRLQEMAMRWNSVVRNRERWDGDGEEEVLAMGARQDLTALGFNQDLFAAVIESGMGEIGIRWREEKLDWEARIMPWEFVIALATRSERRRKGGRLLTIWRYLQVGARDGATAWNGESDTMLFIDAVPVPLRSHLNFRIDQQLLASASGIDPVPVRNPTIDQLQQQVANYHPEILHLAAVEGYEAIELLRQPLPFLPPPNGLCFAQGEAGMETVSNERIAATFAYGSPRLVTLGSQSSTRLAALTVAIGGACAAVGFQDDIDRESMRFFYSEFYRQWRDLRHTPHAALIQTRVMLRAKGIELHGAGLVLWSDRSLIDMDPALIQDEAAAKQSGLGLSGLGSDFGSGSGRMAGLRGSANPPVVEVDCEPLPRLNYSLLHNDRDLFKCFALVSPGDGAVAGVCVRVVLSAGGQDVAWKAQLTLTEVITDLRSKVRVPVVSALGRIKESVRSTLLVEVEVGGKLIHQSTHPVQLLAGDEWTDDDQDRQWLPSFVLPRDPAVTRIVDQAQRALCTLADDPDASFDGYQGLGIRAGDDPGIAVDLQAQALWAALTWDIGLAYVNPPPTYTAAAQRVRSPSAVLEERRGTCIDLALLLAACWERIGLRPVILLLKGHALPGYWRSEAAWDAFRRGDYANTTAESSNATVTGQVPMATAGWMVREHDEVVNLIRAQALWPVEATRIAKRSGFADAVHAGMDALRLPADFDCLIDISVAREKGVLPLP